MIWVLFVMLAVLLILGVPVAFAMIGCTMAFILIDGNIAISLVSHYMVDGLNSFTLMALPLFVLSGALMEYGSTPRIMNMARLLVGKKQWGLGTIGVAASCAFGAVSGSGVACVSAIGSIILPEMKKEGYKPGYAAALIGGAGTLGAIIPPSIIFVVYAQIANVSITDMFLGGMIPGILTGYFLVTLNKRIVLRNNWCTEREIIYASGIKKRKIALESILPMLMPIIILGGVISGIVTPTEAASVATVYAFFLATFIYKELSIREFFKVFTNAAISSSVILLIMSAAQAFAYVITFNNVPQMIGEFFLGIDNYVLIYGLILLILLILGTFMETISIILLTTPIFLPIILRIGVDPVAFGIVMCLALCIGSVTPPLAVCLFTACKIVDVRVEDTFPEVFYVCGAMLIATIVVAAFPILATFLPNLMN